MKGDDVQQLGLPIDDAHGALRPYHDRIPLAVARATDPRTSEQAALSISEEHLQALQKRILALLQGMHDYGLTASEIAAALDMPRDSISPRMKGLVKYGFVVDTGETRPGPSGRAQTVWGLKR